MTSVPAQIWSKNIKIKSIDLTALKKHGKVYEDGKLSELCFFLTNVSNTWPISVNYIMFMSTEQFGCLVWSHSETHLLYVAEKKRPKTESFFQVYQKH